jgi:hypothetical protein
MFNIEGNQLIAKYSFNAEERSIYSIRVSVSDGELALEKEFKITVLDMNEQPTDISLSSTSIDEHLEPNSVVGTLDTEDVDAADNFTYSLVSGADDQDNDKFTIEGDKLIAKESFDFEILDEYFIRIRSTDHGGLFTEKALLISVMNVNENPSDLELSNNTISENSALLSVVGEFSTDDPDNGDEFEYSLVSGDGDKDNSHFVIENARLLTNTLLDYEAKSTSPSELEPLIRVV